MPKNPRTGDRGEEMLPSLQQERGRGFGWQFLVSSLMFSVGFLEHKWHLMDEVIEVSDDEEAVSTGCSGYDVKAKVGVRGSTSGVDPTKSPKLIIRYPNYSQLTYAG